MNNFHDTIQSLLANTGLTVLVVILTAFAISLFSIPIIINIARSKNIYDKPNGRTSHNENTPTLGGIALFAGIIISLLVFGNIGSSAELNYLIASLALIFFIGITDDIYIISLSKKFAGQIIVISVLIFFGDIRFSSLYGFLGFYEIPYLTSILISGFVFIVIINCINLIDGVDGLASGLSILISAIFMGFFYLEDSATNLYIAASLFGSLVPFFIYNVFGGKNKLFMGDTGALIIGVVSVVLIVKFNELSEFPHSLFRITAAPAMSIAIFFVPLYDTLQVFMLRLLKKKSPFSPDKNHLHHRLLRLGLSHIQTSFTLIAFNALVIIISYFMQFLGIFTLSALLLFIGLMFSTVIWYLLQKQAKSIVY